ncbi:MAG TPA: calcium/sodium antiporter [Opitutaceae bacterium]|nr:calcium/sodium antiporter [Opitutaceae bacterium]
METALIILGGLVLLTLGGEFLVRGAVRIAAMLGMSPLLIGLTLVGFGTSVPELVTSVQASIAGSSGIAIGNIVGSNIANILLILGLAALISPIAVGASALRRDAAMVVFTAVLMGAVGWLWTMDRAVGVVFSLLLAGYLVYAYRQERETSVAGDAPHTAAFEKGEALEELIPHTPKKAARSGAGAVAIAILLVLAGLALLVFGGGLLVDGAIGLARGIGVSESVIGLTIVAIGTSMPELVTSVVAAMRKHSDVALGNVLGSNIYNVLGVGGLTALISPTDISAEMLNVDIPVMIGVSLLLVAFASTGRLLSRIEGALLVAGYIAYVALIWPQ